MNFFHHKYLGNHLLQLCPKVVKHPVYMGTAVTQWLRCCVTNLKVAGLIPGSVTGFFIDIKTFRPHYDTGVDSASNRNEYQEHFWGVKVAGE